MLKKSILFFFFFIVASFSQEDQIIKNIRAEYYNIRESLDALKVDTVQVFGLSAEGMEVVTYRDRTKNLRFLSIWNYGEMGKQYEEYYFVEEKLIFVFSESHNYNVPFYLTGEKAKEVGSEPFDPNKTVVKEDRYYFNADKLIRWLDHKKNKIDPNSQDFKDTEKSILDFVEKILEEVKSAKKL